MATPAQKFPAPSATLDGAPAREKEALPAGAASCCAGPQAGATVGVGRGVVLTKADGVACITGTQHWHILDCG